MKLPAAALFATLFAACQSSTTREWLVANQSLTPVEIYVVASHSGDTLRQTIAAGQTKPVYILTQDGAGSGVLLARSVFDTAQTVNTTGRFMQKDFFNTRFWSINIVQEKMLPSHYAHQYTFTVTESDF
ncbi:MAG: hypothetical protein MUC87_16290 [Bacteroidia bacterium]|jgi:hypothetical protein|nr:hypothetical protein [Bacteroidia bacterium]